MKKLIIEKGYSLVYKKKYSSGMISNVDSDDPLILNINNIGGEYHISYTINGIYIQAWAESYHIKKTGCDD